MASYKVEICGVNTSKLPVLSKKEKEELSLRLERAREDNAALLKKEEASASPCSQNIILWKN